MLETEEDTLEDVCSRIEGRNRGKGLLASHLDRDKNVQFVILRTNEFHSPSTMYSNSSNTSTVCDFPGQAVKKRVALVILYRGHIDLFVLRTSNHTQVLFEVGKTHMLLHSLLFAHVFKKPNLKYHIP